MSINKQPLPEIRKLYNCFDDGKICESRKYDVVITNIVPFEEADEYILELWHKRKNELPGLFDEVNDNLFDETTDYFLIGVSSERDGIVDRVFFARSKGGWFGLGDWFCAGRLDVDGTLNNKLNEDRK